MNRIFFLLLTLIIALVIIINAFPQNSQFFGAFFAFLFVIIVQIFKLYYERIKDNHNAIVGLQQELVCFIHSIESNIREIKGILNGFDSEKKQFSLYFFQPAKIVINKSILLKITKLRFVQDILNIFLELESLNHIINAIKESNDALRVFFKVGDPIPVELIDSRKERLLKTIQILDQQLEKIYVLLAKARVLAKENEARYWLKFDTKINYSSKEEKLFKLERQKLKI